MTRRTALALGAGGLVWAGSSDRGAGADLLPTAIRLVQGGNPGGSYDRYSRVFAAAVAELRPPMRIVVEPMPRANGRLAARLLMGAAPDGATIGTFQTSLAYSELLGDDGVAYETRRLGWIGSFNVEPRILVASARSGIATLAALRALTRPVPVGTDTMTSVGTREPLLLNTLLGTRLRPVAGYSTALRNLGLVSGEIVAATASIDAVHPLIAGGDVHALLRLDRHVAAPPLDTLPTLHDLAATHRTGPVFAFLDAHARLGRWLCMPPGAAPALLAAWREFFVDIVGSATFKRLTREAGLAEHGSTIVPGAAIDAALAEMFDPHAAMAEALKTALACGQRMAETGERACA